MHHVETNVFVEKATILNFFLKKKLNFIGLGRPKRMLIRYYRQHFASIFIANSRLQGFLSGWG
jgi:hypothetical protein